MEKFGFVEKETLGNFVTYYLTGTSRDQNKTDLILSKKNGAVRMIMAYLTENPGVPQPQIAKAINSYPSLIAYHLRRLEEAKCLKAVGERGRRRYFPV